MTSGEDEAAELQQLASSGPARDGGFLARAAAALPPGPAESDLILLCNLAPAVAVAVAAAEGREMNVHQAGRSVVAALLGDGHHAGEIASRLQVFRIYTSGPEVLSEFVYEFEEAGEKVRRQSEREEVLRALSLALVERGRQIHEVQGAAWLAVLREDACRAFGLDAFRAAGTPAVAGQVLQASPSSEQAAATTGRLPDAKRLYDEWVAAGGREGGTRAMVARYGVTARAVQLAVKPAHDALAPKTSARGAAKGKGKSRTLPDALAGAWQPSGKVHRVK